MFCCLNTSEGNCFNTVMDGYGGPPIPTILTFGKEPSSTTILSPSSTPAPFKDPCPPPKSYADLQPTSNHNSASTAMPANPSVTQSSQRLISAASASAIGTREYGPVLQPALPAALTASTTQQNFNDFNHGGWPIGFESAISGT